MVNEIRIPIIGEDRASRPMKDVAGSADLAAAGARRLADALDAQARAAKVASDADYKLARANAVLDVTQHKINAEQDRVAQKLRADLQAARSPGLGRALVSGSAFRALFGGGAGGAGSAAAAAPAAASPLLDFLGSPVGAGGAAAGLLGAAGPIASLISAAIGQGAGTGVAGIGAGLVAKFNPRVLAPGLTNIQKTLSTVAQSIGPSLGLMLAQFGRFVQGLAPQLSKLFASSLPFMQQFFKLAEIGAKTILPALTQVLQSMVKSGALKQMTQAFVFLLQGVADFITHIGGPAMKAGAEIFRALALGIKGALIGLGATLGWLGRETLKWLHNVHQSWDVFRHDTADVFDGVRHDIAHYWDLIWNNTVARVQHGVADVNNWFHKLPGMIIHSLEGLGTDLYNFAHMAMTKMWNGLKSVFGSVWSWFKSLPSKLLNAIGIHSPPDWAIEAGKHIMGGLLRGVTSRKDELLSRMQAMNSQMQGVLGRYTGPTGGIPGLMRQMAAGYGWTGSQWNALYNVEMREAGFNPNARNPSSGAYGLAQFIGGPSEYYQYGGNPNTPGGQIAGMLNYIRQRYGSPMAAWQHELASGWYGSGLANGVFTKPTLIGVGERGPELVNVRPLHGAGSGGGAATYNVYVTVGHGTHPVAAAQELVKILNQGAHLGGVKLRSSILGPG